MEVKLSERRYSEAGELNDHLGAIDLISIEWLSAQNPNAKFSKDRPKLPGQLYPGLGVLSYCFDLMYKVAEIVKRDGFYDMPEELHGAIMYSKRLKFLDPIKEGMLQALMRDLKGVPLATISLAEKEGRLINLKDNKAFKYEPKMQIFYVSSRLRKYFKSKWYKKEVAESMSQNRFKII